MQTQIDKLSAQGTCDGNSSLAMQKQLDAHGAEHLQLVSSLRSRYPKYAQLASLKPATASQAKQLIGGGEMFVSYLLTTAGMAQAFVLDASGEAKWVDLGQIKNHAKPMVAYRELVSPGTEDGPQDQVVALKDGGYQWLPSAQALPAGASKDQRWIISPDKDLALLPFDTLVEAFDATGKPASLRTFATCCSAHMAIWHKTRRCPAWC